MAVITIRGIKRNKQKKDAHPWNIIDQSAYIQVFNKYLS